MNMPIPPPPNSHSSSWASPPLIISGTGIGGINDASYVPRTYAYHNSSIPRPSSAASAFSVTMPCAMAWKEKTGIYTIYGRSGI